MHHWLRTNAELSVRMHTEAGPVAGAKAGVTVDHQETQPARPMQDRADRREFTQIELTRPVRQYLRQGFSALRHYLAEPGITAITAAARAPPELR